MIREREGEAWCEEVEENKVFEIVEEGEGQVITCEGEVVKEGEVELVGEGEREEEGEKVGEEVGEGEGEGE
eukprot:CAMPEP_0201486564 /NCGR_PEP_ID=MMETSP0151_2-20130828/10625_1 /ASSEMBLY_ACC=CAM_ASM_000257 /TAXON_ID=200890 /ORGANISM="Paramoeba atlantica, Strain 621/1 / CCAP 1560/9" /LENGTH=70 /DNA_ID=CAMNT_0047871271 /DNA_START=291 /DNA_END=503 /DNA_ORIENTATION=+